MNADAPTAAEGSTGLDPDVLKARFKAICLATNNLHQNWQIRVHRSLSWAKRASQFDPAAQPEARFLFLWIALNSLYGSWDEQAHSPDPDARCREAFIGRLCEMGRELIGRTLHQNKGLLKKVLGDPFLSSAFWEDPEHHEAKRRGSQDLYHLDGNLKNGEYCRVLYQLAGRLAVLRGQIVHGASTGGSRLNRSAVKYCLATLEQLVPVIQHVVINQGCGDDWPALCYPPIK